MSLRRSLSAAAVLLAVSAAPASAAFTPGAAGGGDPFYPQAGNGGYDVKSYTVKLDYQPQNEQLAGDVTIAARATQDLSSFNVDLRGFNVGSVTVNGSAAQFTRKGQELTIAPGGGLRRNSNFTTRIVYAGHVNNVRDPDHARDGWIPTEDGAYVVNEPQGTPSWLPVNDSLKDFATWDFTVTVPKGRTVVGNGTLVSKTDSGDSTTWRWRESSPMVSYLATVTNGFFEVRTRTLANGLPEFNAVDPQTRFYGEKTPRPEDAWANLAVQPEAVDFLSGLYGPYPFESVGGIVDWAPNVFFALETQTKPNYDVLPDELTIVHELAHQWFGDALVLDHWSDMWLNEGFATWSEWIWTERHGGQSAHDRFNELYSRPAGMKSFQDLWFPAPDALPGPADLFGTPVYDRGGMTLQALREKVGDTTFFRIMRDWYAEHRYSNVTTEQFIATAERDSGRQLDGFFDVWLFQDGRPEPGSW